jgi:hypothetical protein
MSTGDVIEKCEIKIVTKHTLSATIHACFTTILTSHFSVTSLVLVLMSGAYVAAVFF